MFEGVHTALVTPFNRDGSVDYGAYRALIDDQVAAGVDGIVPCGTTGESPTLDFDEHEKVVATAIEAAAGRVKVIAGTGANSTAEAVELTRAAQQAGADGTLQVTPYYNKPSQAGLEAHFRTVADIGLPVMLYNVPGRTSREIAVETIVKLADHPHIVAVKEAGGSVDRVSAIRRQSDITVLSGDDTLTLPMMAVGASGVVSVASNLIPAEVTALVREAREGRWGEARARHLRLHELFETLLSLDSNPVPVKTALAIVGKVEDVFRLPMVGLDPALRPRLETVMRAAGVTW